jgi:hypothetical protein
MLLLLLPQKALIAVDLSGRKANVIGEGNVREGRILRANVDTIAYKTHDYLPRHFYRTKQFTASFDGSNQKELSSTIWSGGGRNLIARTESLDGRYVGLVKHPDESGREVGFVAITDSAGNILHKHEFPILEGGNIFSTGWDFEGRFYFIKNFRKRQTLSTVWRMHSANGAVEEVSFLPGYVQSPDWVNLSPDGKWIKYSRHAQELNQYQEWLCNISSEECRPVSEYPTSFVWSEDYRKIAFVEDIPRRLDAKFGTVPDEADLPRLIIYNVETGERSSISFDSAWRVWASEWSPSGEHLLLGVEKHHDEAGNRIRSGHRSGEPYIFTLASGRLERAESPTKLREFVFLGSSWSRDSARISWTMDDRLVWALREKLIATEKDGSDPQELFRVRDGKYYLYGEEVG